MLFAIRLMCRIMKAIVLTYLLTSMLLSASIAQQPDTVFTLQPVTISSECQKQNQLAVKMDSILFQYQVNGSATQLLQRNSMLYVRQFGSGALATLNSLGFNSARNPVLWNSMLLNNPMNASQDINLIPLWFLERSSIQSVSYPFSGTSVSLYSNPKFENSLSLFTSYQSFGNLNYGVKWKQNFRRLSLSFAGIHQRNQNRINYFNSYELKKDTMEHARADMLGVNTLLQYRISESNTLEACVWYVDANRLLPPSMLQTISRSVEFDKQLRAYLQWTLRKNRFKSVWQNSVNNDIVIYHDSLSAIYADNHSRVYQSQWQGEYFAGNQLAIPVMFRYQYIEATTDNYILRVIQQRLYLEAAPRLLIPSWHTTAQITASREIAMGLYAANALKATLIKSFGSAWVWTNEAGRLFQLPTLNDIFWKPGGNPELKPEHTLKLQSTLRYYSYKRLSIESNTSLFHYLSDQAIVWRPNGNYWSPVNLQNTSSYGLTELLQLGYRISALQLMMETSYTYNRTKVTATKDPLDESLGQEIPYSPRHRCFSSLTVSHKHLGLMLQYQFTSARNSTFNPSSQMEPYQIIDAGIHGIIARKKLRVRLNLMINNIMNQSYETVAWQAMPGRNLSLQLLFSYTKYAN